MSTELEQELGALRLQYDSFVESSQELEQELERELKDAQKTLDEAAKKRAAAEDKATAALENYSKLMKEQERVQQDLAKTKEKLTQSDTDRVRLENANTELQQRVRILEGTEEDLKHKLENAQEDVIFIQGDLDDLKAAKEESERNLRAELAQFLQHGATGLASPIAAATPSPKRSLNETAQSLDFDSSCETVPMTPQQQKQILEQQQENTELIEELEKELEAVSAKLAESEKQNEELNEELSRGNDEIINLSQQRAEAEAKLKAEMAALKASLEKTTSELGTASSAQLTAQLAESQKAAAAEKAGLEKQLADKEKAAAAEKEALTKQIATLQASGSDAAAQLTAQLAESQKAAAAEKAGLEKQLADKEKAAAAEKEALTKQIEALQTAREEKNALVEKVQLLESSLNEAVSIADELSTQRQAAAAEVASLQQQLRSLHESHAEAVAKSGQLSAQLFEVGMQHATEKDSLQQSLESCKAQLAGEKDALQKQVSALQVSAAKAAELIFKLEERVHQQEGVETQLAAVQLELEQRSHDEERHAAQIESLTQLLQVKTSEMESVQQRLVQQASEVAVSHQELVEALELELREAREKLLSTERDRNVLLVAVDRHAEQLDAATSAAAKLREQDLQVLTAERDKDREAATALQLRLQTLEQELVAAQNAAMTFTRVETTALTTPISPSRLPLPAVADVLADMRSSHPRAAAEQAMSHNDAAAMKAELSRQLELFDTMRASNAALLGKLQVLQGTIQVCCRTRPPSDQELSQGGRVCVDASDEMQLQCFDHRGNVWRSFAFDHVWRPEAGQWEVFADIEPLLLNVIDGFNVCILACKSHGRQHDYLLVPSPITNNSPLLPFPPLLHSCLPLARRRADGFGQDVHNERQWLAVRRVVPNAQQALRAAGL